MDQDTGSRTPTFTHIFDLLSISNNLTKTVQEGLVYVQERYGEAFKRKVVMEVENGILRMDSATYGRLRYSQTQTRTVRAKMMSEETQKRPQRRVKAPGEDGNLH
jgi:hypothetical protein